LILTGPGAKIIEGKRPKQSKTLNKKLFKEIKGMNKNFMKAAGLAFIAIGLGLVSMAYADLPQVIGNWEDSNDDWYLADEADPCTTAQSFRGNASLGNYSYKVFAAPGWQKAVMRDLTYDANLLEALGNTRQIKVDITLKAKEWDIGAGWIKAIEALVIQDDRGNWQQFDPVGDGDAVAWDGKTDKTFTIAFDIPEQTPPPLTQGKIILITSYDGVTTAGNFYFDNVRLLGTAEQPKPKEPNEPEKQPAPI
jgi:hypothetical protein